MTLIQHHPNLYTLDAPLPKNPIGRRMSVIRFNDQELALHSPILLEGEQKARLDQLGKVRYILVPNEWHTLDTQAVSAQYPDAKIIIPAPLKSRLSKKFNCENSYEAQWQGPISEALSVNAVDGLKKPEMIFFHHESKSLIVTDLFFNFNKDDFSGPTQWLMKMNKATQLGTTRLYQWSMVKDTSAFKSSLHQITQGYDIQRLIPCHGHIINDNAQAKIEKAIHS
ncbi:MAG: hypothetical protein CL521_03910 [Actinobacteria bacterium]|nr:hypothetical protein [Actinomycetota bacterium]|tara:strand:+ start:1131 stop:1805 length:675 start_codon:yes stop_codon:yes gene_type:complete